MTAFFLFSCCIAQLLSEEVDKVSNPTGEGVSVCVSVCASWKALPVFVRPFQHVTSVFSWPPAGRARASCCSDRVRPTSWGHQAAAGGHQQHTCVYPACHVSPPVSQQWLRVIDHPVQRSDVEEVLNMNHCITFLQNPLIAQSCRIIENYWAH